MDIMRREQPQPTIEDEPIRTATSPQAVEAEALTGTGVPTIETSQAVDPTSAYVVRGDEALTPEAPPVAEPFDVRGDAHDARPGTVRPKKHSLAKVGGAIAAVVTLLGGAYLVSSKGGDKPSTPTEVTGSAAPQGDIEDPTTPEKVSARGDIVETTAADPQAYMQQLAHNYNTVINKLNPADIDSVFTVDAEVPRQEMLDYQEHIRSYRQKINDQTYAQTFVWEYVSTVSTSPTEDVIVVKQRVEEKGLYISGTKSTPKATTEFHIKKIPSSGRPGETQKLIDYGVTL